MTRATLLRNQPKQSLRNTLRLHSSLLVISAAALNTGCTSLPSEPESFVREPGTVTGYVYEDRDSDGVRSPGDRSIEGVRVSNGRNVVQTDRSGRYVLPVRDDTTIFVIKPSGMRTVIDDRNLPRFYYFHKPAGSPAFTIYPGVPPTGPLPQSVDFPLYRQRESSPFRVLVVGDPQPKTISELNFFSHDVVAELPGHDAAFGITLGDVVDNDLSLYDPITQATALVGIPWYNVLGNHDLNLDARSDRTSDATFERVFGPSTYAFEYAHVHFVVLDDVEFRPASAAEEIEAGYRGGLTPMQLEFIEAYVSSVPKDERIVLLMHIPLVGRDGHQVPQRQELYKILAKHPHTQSISAHTHMQGHVFLGEKDGNHGPIHHHWNSPTAAGSWWRGRPDERGIPHTLQRDGSPNGYSIMTFDGVDYSIRFKPARRPANHQMDVHAPHEVTVGEKATIFANVFAGSERSEVGVRFIGPHDGETPYRAMQLTREKDPAFMKMRAREELTRGENEPALPHPSPSMHLWRSDLPRDLPAGSYWIEVKSTDMFGQVDFGRRVIRVVPAGE